MMCIDSTWQQRLRTVCNVSTLLVLRTTANLQSYRSSTCCVAERAQGAPALSRCPTFYPWTTQAPLPSQLTRAAAAAAAAKSSSPSLVYVEGVPHLCCGSCSGLSTNNSFATEFCIPCGAHVQLEQKRIFSFVSYDLRKWKCRFCE